MRIDMEQMTEQDVVSFGNYLLSNERRKLYEEHLMFPDGEALEERLAQVNHADFENWKSLNVK